MLTQMTDLDSCVSTAITVDRGHRTAESDTLPDVRICPILLACVDPPSRVRSRHLFTSILVVRRLSQGLRWVYRLQDMRRFLRSGVASRGDQGARSARIVVLAGALLVTSGCGGSNGTSRSTVSRRVVALSRRAHSKGWYEQAALMADGTLTDAEHRQANVDMFACMRRAGLRVGIMHKIATPFGVDYSANISGRGLPEAEAHRRANACQDRFESLVSYAVEYQEGGRFTPEALAKVRSCLRKAGLDPGDANTQDEVIEKVGDRLKVFGCIPPTNFPAS
jgi:hypothetical protein